MIVLNLILKRHNIFQCKAGEHCVNPNDWGKEDNVSSLGYLGRIVPIGDTMNGMCVTELMPEMVLTS